MSVTGAPRVIPPAAGRLAVIVVVFFVVWIAGVAWWSKSRAPVVHDSILGEWTNSMMGDHRLIVHAGGTFDRFVHGQWSSGNWKPVKAWRLDSVTGMRPVLPYHADEDFEISSLSRDWKGSIRRTEHAYLFDERGIEDVVVPIQDRAGTRLEGNEMDWSYHRPRIWPSWLSNPRFLTIPVITL